MITEFEKFNERYHIDRKHSNLETEFAPNEPVLQKIYYTELEKLYVSDVNKYRLILDILEASSKIGKKKPNFTNFKHLLKMTIINLKQVLKKWIDLADEDWYLPDLEVNTEIKKR